VSQQHTDREAVLTRAFVELADTLVDDYDVIEVLDRLVAHSMALLSAEAAGIMLVDSHGQLRVVASSNEESDWTELMQIQADQGPCVDCVRTGQPVVVTAGTTCSWARSPAASSPNAISPARSSPPGEVTGPSQGRGADRCSPRRVRVG